MIFPAEIEKKIIEDITSENYTLVGYYHAKMGKPYSMTLKFSDRRILFSVVSEKDVVETAFANELKRRYRASIQSYNWFGRKSKVHMHINMTNDISNDLSKLLEGILDNLYKEACIQDCLDDIEADERRDDIINRKIEKVRSKVLRNVK